MSLSDELTEHAARNRAYWDRTSDSYHQANARFIEGGLAWGLWQVPESERNVLGLVAARLALLRQGVRHVRAAARQRLLRPPSPGRSRRCDGVQPHLRRMDRGLLQERVCGRGPDRDPAAAWRDLDVPERGRDG